MEKKNKTESHIKKLEDLQKKIADLKQAEKDIQEKIISNFSHILHYYNGFSVPITIIIGALISAIETYKDTPEKTGDWHDMGEKFLKVRGRPSSKKAF
jgi:hypothetical protein